MQLSDKMRRVDGDWSCSGTFWVLQADQVVGGLNARGLTESRRVVSEQ